jgi:hypothetical protein
MRREGADTVRKGRPWGLPMEDRILPVVAYSRAHLTLRQLALLFGPSLALQPRKRFRKDAC